MSIERRRLTLVPTGLSRQRRITPSCQFRLAVPSIHNRVLGNAGPEAGQLLNNRSCSAWSRGHFVGANTAHSTVADGGVRSS